MRPSQPGRRRPWRWVLIGAVVVAVLAVAGPFVYINLIRADAPAPLSVGAVTPTTQAAPGDSPSAGAGTDVSGTWTATSGSQAGYRVKEVLNGQSAEAVGRTSAVTGTMTVDGTTVTAATFTVDMTTVQSDQSRRDGQFQGRIMETSTFPAATFKLTEPIDVGQAAVDGGTVTPTATGELTLHGATRVVTVDLSAKRTGDTIQVSGQIPVIFAEYNIANPSFGPVTTEDNGVVELLVVLARG